MSKVVAGGVAAVLWLVSVAIALFEIVVVRELVMSLYAWVLSLSGAVLDVHGKEFWAGVTLRNFVVLILAVVVMAFAVATGEYHAKQVGTRASWRLFGWTFAVQLVIFAVSYLV